MILEKHQAIVISPHLDDGVFGCGDLLARSPGQTVMTVFAGGPGVSADGGPMDLKPWDALAGFKAGEDVTASRRQEDWQALQRLDAQPRWLPFWDSQYGRPALVGEIAARLRKEVLAMRPSAIFFPMGLFHSDHELTHEACLLLCSSLSAEWYLYEDAIYRRYKSHPPQARLNKLMGAGFSYEAIPCEPKDASDLKKQAVHCYASQLKALGSTPGHPGYQDVFAPEQYYRLKIREKMVVPADSKPGPTHPTVVIDSGLRRARATASPDSRVAAVIITRNRSHELARTLEHMLALPEQAPVVVVDNASSDDTVTMIRTRFPQVQLVALSDNRGAAGRTVGIQQVTQPYVALCDDDCWWEPGSLSRAADLLDHHPDLALVCGRVLVGPDEREDPTCQQMEHSPLPSTPDLPGSPILGFLAGATMMRRSAFLEAGGFEPRLFLGSEEILLALDLATAGWHMTYVKEIVVHHYPSRQRDTSGRRHIQTRNRLWIAWLRWPALRALGYTFSSLRTQFRDHTFRQAFVEALKSLPWIMQHRRVIPPHVDWALQQVDNHI